MTKPTKKKILANIWEPLILKLNAYADDACLQRDAYLDRVFRNEAEMLDKEMEHPNSKEGGKQLARHLALLNRKPVNFALSPETVEAMSDVCMRKNLPRDAFLNRVLLFLVAKQPDLFERLLPFDVDWYWTERVVNACAYDPPLVPYHLNGSLSVLTSMTHEDPFWAIRACIDEARTDDASDELLHQAEINKDFFGDQIKSALGFNCHFRDKWIEGHPAEKEWQEMMDLV